MEPGYRGVQLEWGSSLLAFGSANFTTSGLLDPATTNVRFSEVIADIAAEREEYLINPQHLDSPLLSRRIANSSIAPYFTNRECKSSSENFGGIIPINNLYS